MSNALFTGKPVAKPGSRRYQALPEWVLCELNKPIAGTGRRVRDPDRGRGFTVVEAASLLGYAPITAYLLLRRWCEKPGMPDLNGELLGSWDD